MQNSHVLAGCCRRYCITLPDRFCTVMMMIVIMTITIIMT